MNEKIGIESCFTVEKKTLKWQLGRSIQLLCGAFSSFSITENVHTKVAVLLNVAFQEAFADKSSEDCVAITASILDEVMFIVELLSSEKDMIE